MNVGRAGFFSVVVASAFAMVLSGCSSLTPAQRGAVIGGGAGAVVGGVIGKATGSTARGAILGAAVGGAAGAIIGQQMDEQAEVLEEELPGATVQRIGEGIAVTFDSGILFDFDSFALRPEARENLANLAESLEEYADSEVLIVGHTDATGSEDYNQRLSENRAGAAKSFLVEQGIDAVRVEAEGKGEMEPIASNEDEMGQQENRRVEVAIFASEEYRKRLTGGDGS
jgi:outer membrane protein OmpA-like peptidoglycan-associated protein